jgi:hypothetical protein
LASLLTGAALSLFNIFCGCRPGCKKILNR